MPDVPENVWSLWGECNITCGRTDLPNGTGKNVPHVRSELWRNQLAGIDIIIIKRVHLCDCYLSIAECRED